MNRLRHPKILGLLVLAGWAAHAIAHLARGTGDALLWCCNLGALLLGVGLLSARPRVAGAGLLWVTIGTPVWLIGLAMGEGFMPTSLFTHFGAIFAGMLAGSAALPKDAWRTAFVGLFGLHLISHALLPESRDINLIGQGFGDSLLGHLGVAAIVTVALLLVLPLFERGLRAVSQRQA